MKRTLLAVILACAAVEPALLGPAVPSFQVDPLWPKPLPNHWLLGSVTGVAVDARDPVLFTGETLEGKRVQKFILKTTRR